MVIWNSASQLAAEIQEKPIYSVARFLWRNPLKEAEQPHFPNFISNRMFFWKISTFLKSLKVQPQIETY